MIKQQVKSDALQTYVDKKQGEESGDKQPQWQRGKWPQELAVAPEGEGRYSRWLLENT